MPLVRITLPKGSSAEDKVTLAEQAYQAMRETIGIPEHDKFIVLQEQEPGTLFIDPQFLGVERSSQGMIVEITLRQGRSVEKKQALYRTIADRFHQYVGVRKEDITIVLRENDGADWSFGNGVAQFVGKS